MLCGSVRRRRRRPVDFHPLTVWEVRMKGHVVLWGVVAAGLIACSSSSSTGGNGNGNGNGDSGSTATNDQIPPMGHTALEAWLATGVYKMWNCEMTPHAARSPSIHVFDRVCSNDAISSNATGTSPWPEGAASVKELYDPADTSTVKGYAVAIKTAADSASGANWYWYEREITGTVLADGMGGSGAPATDCVSCHSAAGSDAAHTPTANGRDEVYTVVP
jgi:hypothetical protein